MKSRTDLCALLASAVSLTFAGGTTAATDLDFEAGFEGWTKPQPNWSLVEGAGRNGSRGFVWTGVDTNLYQIASGSVPFKPGAKLRVTAWMRNESLSSGEPGFCVEYFGEKGYLSGAGSHVVGGAKPKKGEWVQYEVVTGPIPQATTKCSIDLYVGKGVTGRCVYDDFAVEMIGYQDCSMLFSTAPNDRAADGRVRFVGTTYADLRTYQPSEVEAFFTFEGEKGAFRVDPASFAGGRAEAYVDVKRLKPGVQTVKFAVRTKSGKELDSRTMTFTRLAAPANGKIWFDEHRRMIVDGKPTYPLLVYSHFGTIRDPRFVPAMKASPFKMMMSYTKKANREDLDYFQANGLKAFVGLNTSFARALPWERPEDMNAVDEEIAHTVRVMKDVQDHPALLGWYLYDEPTAEMMPRLRERYKLVKELDADHPCLTVLCHASIADNAIATCDVIGLDSYPVPGHGTEATLPADLGSASRVTRTAIDLMRRDKPFWFVPQAFPNCDGRARFPTLHELRAMVWQAVAAGADGVLFYALNEMLANRENEGYNFEKSWKITCTVAQELRDREDFLLSVEPAPVLANVPQGVVARAWRSNGKTMLVAVNTTHAPVKGTLTLDGRPVGIDLGGDDVLVR